MCGRFTLRAKLNVVLSHFGINGPSVESWEPRFNIAPSQSVPIIRGAPKELAFASWGLIPSWAKDAKIAAGTINARAETVATKPAFRAAFKRRRCLVLADGYYEWLRSGKSKQPYFYEVDGGRPFAFAGLWESWQSQETCTIITTEANELANAVHDRMPVILEDASQEAWLDPEFEDATRLLGPFPSERMSVRPVSTYVNNARNQGPECLEEA